MLAIAGTRPECIKLAAFVDAMRSAREPLSLLVSGQHPETCRRTLAEFGVTPDAVMPMVNGASLVARLNLKIGQILDFMSTRRVALVVVQGDTLTALAGAMAARRAGVPLAHIEAGLRAADVSNPFPEEWIRRKIARMATLHFSPSRVATTHLRNEGIDESRIFEVGNTSVDILRRHAGTGWEAGATHGEILVSVHRRECQGPVLLGICAVIRRLSMARPNVPIRWVLPPNPASWTIVARELQGLDNVQIEEPLTYRDMLQAYRRAVLVLTDSGGIQEELPYLGRRFILLRDSTERPEPFGLGYGVLAGVDEDSIFAAIQHALTQELPRPWPYGKAGLYGAGDAGERIADIVRRYLHQKDEWRDGQTRHATVRADRELAARSGAD